jgi:short-subunit dehydrogenase
MTAPSDNRPRALVTGASAGIGSAYAGRLARDGYDVVIVARRRERLEALAAQLRAAHGATITPLAADLSRPDDLRAVERHIAESGPLDLLVNNAGFGGYMPFAELNPDRAEEQLYLQVVAVTRLTRTALPAMLARGRGAIVNVSSRLAFSESLKAERLPRRATYAASKAYVNAFSQLLNTELAGSGVQVQALCPGVVRTEFHQIMGANVASFPPAIVMAPEDVVQASLAALRLGDVVCLPSLDDRALLNAIYADQQRLFELTGGGALAKRYLPE